MLTVRGRLALAVAATMATAAGAVAFTGAAAAGTGCLDTRDVFVTDVTAAEGTGGNGTTTLTLTVQSRGCPQAGDVAYTLKPLTTDIRDLTYVSGTLTFADGDTREQTLKIDVYADYLDEPDEQFAVRLTGLSGELRACEALSTITLVNDDQAKDPGAEPGITIGYTKCELHSSRQYPVNPEPTARY